MKKLPRFAQYLEKSFPCCFQVVEVVLMVGQLVLPELSNVPVKSNLCIISSKDHTGNASSNLACLNVAFDLRN